MKVFSISVSIVLYNDSVDTIEKIINILLRTELSIKIYLIDNSKVGLQNHPFPSNIEYLHTNRNIGYGAGHNLALKKSIQYSDYHLILNADVHFEPGTLEIIYQYMEANHQVGQVMPKVLYPNGDIQYLCKLLPSPLDLILRRFIPGNWYKRRLNKFELRSFSYDKILEVPNLSGCFMFLRSSAIKKVGVFDERFFLYAEDTDLTRRIHHDYKTVFLPDACIIHMYQKSSYKNLKMLLTHIVSVVKYFNKWGWVNDAERKKVNNNTLNQLID